MTSLEVLVLTAFALLIIFAALPYVVSMLYASLAPLEYRSASGFILAFSDGLEADFGLPGARKYFNLPQFVYGSFGPVARQRAVAVYCGGVPNRFAWMQLEVWYNSSYLVEGPKPLRGVQQVLLARPGDVLIAANTTGRLVRAYSRLFLAEGNGEAYIYLVNATVRVTGRSYLYYNFGALKRVDLQNCIDPRLVVDGAELWRGSGTYSVYLVAQSVDVVMT